ncbi:RNA polymerase sigma factor (sigma-70 family) [Actinokineospora baliensis]|uniref:RNA polymerase sigma factor n=1 Tax=Actinokineospora baliensis TaxID=547056 RepID=UPI00195A6425|nr:sigma-70 family RNA polymerase sigma factor [Actinokineospora baliensis]MBM7775897.1 RNA polymerase sigma factor (sigma-70 family) [Actinokineospora baliensis]
MTGVEGDLLRELAPRVLAALVRRHGWMDGAEDAVQEALLAAATQWPTEGTPDNPRAWLVTVASRRLVDHVRSEVSRKRREDDDLAARSEPPAVPDLDDSLQLLFLCCHPELSASSRIALTLRAVGGLSTAQIAAAFLVPEATMAQRISRAKQTIRQVGFGTAGADRLDGVLHVLYLVFTEGHTSTDGTDLTAPALSDEAIRLTRWLHCLLPEDTEVAGLLALMLLTDSHRPARLDASGELVPLAEQDRTRWDRAAITEGIALITSALARGRVGPYQLQAAIAAVHSEAETAADTDWPQIAGLYQLLERIAPNPVVTLNRAVAVGMTAGPAAGLELLEAVASDKRLARNHRLYATRAHLLDLAGDRAGARSNYREAAKHATSAQERRHLTARAQD